LQRSARLGSVAQKENEGIYEESFIIGDCGCDFERLWTERRYVHAARSLDQRASRIDE
jgi:hypothetical protein